MITTHELQEEKILNETPYDWKKHFLFNLPELLYFIIKLLIIVFLFQATTVAIISSSIASVISIDSELRDEIVKFIQEDKK